MRAVGLAVLGLFVGVIFGFILTEIVARIMIGDGGIENISTSGAMTLGLITPVTAVVGAIVGVVVDQLAKRKNEQ
ncbi:MAG TPA: hypothetical protein VI076_03720 [Actinopolymorphaceae bacterium]